MGLLRRVEALERRRRARACVPIVWDGRDVEATRARALSAQARGDQILLVHVCVTDTADTLEDAEALVRQHQEAGLPIPIEILRQGSEDEVLAAWDPGLPDWLKAALGAPA